MVPPPPRVQEHLLTFQCTYAKPTTQQSSLQCSALFNYCRLGGMPFVLILPT